MLLAVTSIARSVIPRTIRREGRELLHRLALGRDRLFGRTIPLDPPSELVQGIGGSWWVGETFLRHFRELCSLTPDEAVLDVGCGVGRMAVPLARYMSTAGRYEGFDIMRKNVRWCQRAITSRWPHFHFQHADIYNREYNPDGSVNAHEYRFPYPNGTFDFALLTSVFTHLMPPDAAHYLSEVGRVLKPGGRCLATFNLLNADSDALIDAGKCKHTMQPRDGIIRVHCREVPEACIALDEAFVRASAAKAALTVDAVRYGTWCGRDPGFEFQDLLILRKPS